MTFNENPVNCWKPKSKDMAISSQASNLEEGSETIHEDGVHTKQCGSAGLLNREDDIVRSPEKSVSSQAKVYKIYYLVSPSTNWYYIGLTKSKLNTRFNQHLFQMRKGTKSPLYDCMRKYEDFLIVLKEDSLTHKEACELEISLIKEARYSNHKILNLADGGQTGYAIPEDKKDSWKEKLKIKRRGRKPALGMHHSEENKKLFSKSSSEYWKDKKYNASEILKYSFKESNLIFGISKTHYYRLRRSLSSEQR